MKNKNIKKVNIVFESLPQFLGLNENLEEAKKIFSKLGFDENSPEWKEFYDIFSSDIDLMDKFVKWLEDGDEEDLRFIIDTIKRAKEVEVPKTEINKFQSLKQYSRGIEKLISDKEKERIKKEVEEKIKKNDPGHPDICTVFAFHKTFNEEIIKDIEEQCKKGCIGCVQCKKDLAKKMIEYISPIYEKRKVIANKPDYIKDIIREGNKKAGEIAKKTMEEVRNAMGIDWLNSK